MNITGVMPLPASFIYQFTLFFKTDLFVVGSGMPILENGNWKFGRALVGSLEYGYFTVLPNFNFQISLPR